MKTGAAEATPLVLRISDIIFHMMIDAVGRNAPWLFKPFRSMGRRIRSPINPNSCLGQKPASCKEGRKGEKNGK